MKKLTHSLYVQVIIAICIGVALGLSALTVKSHLARIARKLGTGDRAEMVAVSMRAGVKAPEKANSPTTSRATARTAPISHHRDRYRRRESPVQS